MLSIATIVISLLWVLGLATSVTFGGLIHLLLPIAFVLLCVRLIRGPGHPPRRRTDP